MTVKASYDQRMKTKATLSSPTGSRETLPVRIAHILRSRIREGAWSDTGRLPTEGEFCAEFGVSRVTIRQAIKLLESQGLVESRQGVGTRITASNGAMVHAGLQELKSITETISEMGLQPSMEHRSKVIRPAGQSDMERFDLPTGAQVLVLHRVIRADREVVAFVDDVMPLWIFGGDDVVARLEGSVFSYLQEHTDVHPKRAVAEVHPRRELPVAWTGDPAVSEVPDDAMYLLLDQLQFDDQGRPFMHTRAHFIDGRFRFVVLRLA